MSTKTGNCLITYDIDKNHILVKDAMKKLGYFDTLTLGGTTKTYSLPNTTLWRNETSTDKAMSDLRSVCLQTSTKLEKAMALLGSDWVGA